MPRARTKVSHQVLLSIAALSASASIAPAAQQTANWLGGNGSWTDATKWSTGVVPNNTATDTFNVNIDNGNALSSSVTLSNTGATTYVVDKLTVDAGDNFRHFFSSLALNGQLAINGTLDQRGYSTLTVAPSTTVAGSGTVLSADGSRLIAASGSLTIGAGITVRGSGGAMPYYAAGGNVGTTALPLVNNGLLLAEPGSVLQINGSSISNSGVIQVGSGGAVVIDTDFSPDTIGTLTNNGGTFVIGKTLLNTGQTLVVDRPFGWAIRGSIQGGTIQSVNNGTLDVTYLHNALIDNATLNGTVTVSGDLTANLVGGNGTILIYNPEALEGSGHVFIGTIPAGITVRGGLSAQFPDPDPYDAYGAAEVTVTNNQGRIRAQKSIFNDPGTLTVRGSGLTNSGILEISDGGTLNSLESITFATSSKLIVDGGGLLSIRSDLNLSTFFDTIDVHPKAGGLPYSNYVVATYTGTRTGIFDEVTPGISVDYTTPGQIKISGTPLPEPTAILLGIGLVLTRRSRRL